VAQGSTKRATIRDVAAHAGVSVATVSRVLNDTYDAPAATRDRVLRAVKALDYHVTQVKTLTSLSGTIAVGIPILESAFFMSIAAGIEEQARAAGRAVLFSATASDPALELDLVDRMRQRGVEAVILMGGVHEDDAHRAALADRAEVLSRTGSRLVLCGRPWHGEPDAPLHVVDYDAEAGAHAVTTYLLSAGHRRIAHIGGPSHYATAQRRLAGYLRALSEFDVPVDRSLVSAGQMSRDRGFEQARALLAESDMTAVFAANDVLAAGVVAAAREAGRQVPGELSVVGFDDIPVARDVYPALTTLHIPQMEVGRAAARTAIYRPAPTSQLPEDRYVVIGTHIVVRDSVRPHTRS